MLPKSWRGYMYMNVCYWHYVNFFKISQCFQIQKWLRFSCSMEHLSLPIPLTYQSKGKSTYEIRYWRNNWRINRSRRVSAESTIWGWFSQKKMASCIIVPSYTSEAKQYQVMKTRRIYEVLKVLKSHPFYTWTVVENLTARKQSRIEWNGATLCVVTLTAKHAWIPKSEEERWRTTAQKRVVLVAEFCLSWLVFLKKL